jgi:hypothetical protein
MYNGVIQSYLHGTTTPAVLSLNPSAPLAAVTTGSNLVVGPGYGGNQNAGSADVNCGTLVANTSVTVGGTQTICGFAAGSGSIPAAISSSSITLPQAPTGKSWIVTLTATSTTLVSSIYTNSLYVTNVTTTSFVANQSFANQSTTFNYIAVAV